MNEEEMKKLEGLVRLVGMSGDELDALVQRVAEMSDDELASEISALKEKIKADEALIKRLQDEVNEAEREMANGGGQNKREHGAQRGG